MAPDRRTAARFAPRLPRARLLALPVLVLAASCPGATPRPTEFAETISALSETGGYFDTDNLISNERSYLHALSDLRAAGTRGGVYLGVGPGQNFSYIAEIEPELAFIVDIRRDNVLQHLIYKALFEASEDRVGFLARLTGRPIPRVTGGESATIDSIVAALDREPATSASAQEARSAIARAIPGFGLALEPGDLETIARFHDEFIRFGLDLRFRSHGRAPQFYYPTLRELVLEVDREGRRASYLSTEERYRRVRRLQLEDRVLPVVADLAGDTGLKAIGALLEERGLRVSAFYTSNVEFYLYGDRTFPRFIENLRALPLAEDAVLIKAFFRGFQGSHPRQVTGYYSTQLVQEARVLLEGWDSGEYRSYWDIVTRGLVMPAASDPGAARDPAPASANR